jgi:hypothetical protein
MKAIRSFKYSRYTRKEDEITVEQTNEDKLRVTATYVGGQYGKIVWHLINGTNDVEFVGLVRGADLNVNGQIVRIADYLFGRAFGDVYYLLGMSTYLTNLTDVPLYTLAVYNNETIGFVFALPPKSVIHVPEYGLTGLVNYRAKLVEVKPKQLGTYVVIYSAEEYLMYYEQLWQNLGILPLVYMVHSYNVESGSIGYGFHERMILKVPQSWINFAVDLTRLVGKI